MTKHKQKVEDCKTWKDLENFVEDNGFEYDHCNGGHKMYNCPNKNARPVTISTHENAPSKHLLCHIRKEIIAGMGVVSFITWLLFYFHVINV